MDSLRDSYRDDDDDDDGFVTTTTTTTTTTTASTNNGSADQPPDPTTETLDDDGNDEDVGGKDEPLAFASDDVYEDDDDDEDDDEADDDDDDDDSNSNSNSNSKPSKPREIQQGTVQTPLHSSGIAEDDDEDEGPRPKKQKPLSSLPKEAQSMNPTSKEANGSLNSTPVATVGAKKVKKKNNKSNSVWTKPAPRKGKKKGGKTNNNNGTPAEDKVLITPVPKFPDKNDDKPGMSVCLSKAYKAEKVELSEDRMCAGSIKGYRMVRATRGVMEGAWYFEIKVVKLGETGHTRLGWSTEKGDLQAPVGYDVNSFGYRDIDGCKIHKALREKYGEEGYTEGDVIGFYINLPEGSLYAPKPPHLVWYKGHRYVCAPDAKEDPPKIVPGSEISFFKNGVCQGVAFKDLYGGRYYPAASMYTLPNQPNCTVKFNFGPDFEFFPNDFDGRSVPLPMFDVPYHGFDNRVENSVSSEKQQ